jgi:signal transduction histidine kinase
MRLDVARNVARNVPERFERSRQKGRRPASSAPIRDPVPVGWSIDMLGDIRTARLAEQVFAGKGEMAALVRETDWSKTPIGPVESWPQSLRTAVSICLDSRHPIVLWWGPERWMFYNDAYRPMLGQTKHPQFLGASGQACWAEIWSIIGPMMDQVIATGEATWSEDLFLLMSRSGYLEETYFTFSYSPIRDESGKPSGIFNACTESTARVLADRRMKTLREMSVEARSVDEAAQGCAAILGHNPKDVPFALVYLADGSRLRLAGRAGIDAGTLASPVAVELEAPDAGGWPLARVASHQRGEHVTGLAERFDCLPRDPWDQPPHEAMVLPFARAGAAGAAGVLVLGVNPRRAFDDDYRGFFDLVAGRVAAAVSNARAFEEERERAAKLSELDVAKTTFFSNVSHEFRTPLTLMIGPLEDALAAPERSLGAERLEAVHRNALRLLKLVNSLLDFARVEADRFRARFEPTDLALVTGGLAGSFHSLMESAGLRLVIDCPSTPEPVFVDRSQWEKIVSNLISNAFKFTFEGEIAVRLRAGERDVELSVSDTGTGIPPEELPKIFDRFHRVEGARGRSFEGTGIGLALVQELVKHHGGSVRVDSVVGKGSTFSVTIPRGEAHLPKDRVALAGPRLAGTAGAAPWLLEAEHWVRQPPVDAAAAREQAADLGPRSGSQARVLVADDNVDMRAYLVQLLASRWSVQAVENGAAALEAALREPPDLVLSDVMMPKMDGVELLRALRAEASTRMIPFILLSARAGEEAVVTGLDTGADDYLVKPFSARELLSRVETHLKMARVRRAAEEAARELAETRAAMLEDVERRNSELEAFSYSASHDLRAPLRTIAGFAEILLEDHAGQLDEEGRGLLQTIRDAAKRMDRLIDDLLMLSRVERKALRREAVDLGRLGHHVARSLNDAAPEHRVDFAVEDGLIADGDPGLLQILLENVLGNAWKFTRKTGSPKVEVGSRENGEQRTFFVRDNGAGFDAAHAQRLFTPFLRLHTETEFPGFGIGLATVKRIVERHGGHVWAEGAVASGATICWTLPSTGP